MDVYQFQKADGGDWSGELFLAIKDNFVASGFTVRGSGDGLTRHGDIDGAVSVPLGQRGSGGEYDCWSVANTTNGVAGGAGNTNAWCWLRSPDDSWDMILTTAISTSPSFRASMRWGMSRSDSTGFVGGSTSATVFPTAPTEGSDFEIWVQGSRASASGSLHNNNTSTNYGTLIVEEGGNEFAWFSTRDSSGSPAHASSFAGRFAIVQPHPDDPDPWLYGRSRFNSTHLEFWDWVNTTWQTTNTFGNQSINADWEIGAYTVGHQQPFRAGSSGSPVKGHTNFIVAVDDSVLTFGDRYTDIESGDTYLYPDAGGGWDGLIKCESDTELEALALASPASDNDLWVPTRAGAAGPSVSFVNRVWDTNAGGFVRWVTEDAEDSAGASYPGPGTFGVDTSDYVVEQIR